MGIFSVWTPFAAQWKQPKSDTMIILGDAGFNYYLNDRDTRAKKSMPAPIPVKFFCIHGNHEARPQRIRSYVEGEQILRREDPL